MFFHGGYRLMTHERFAKGEREYILGRQGVLAPGAVAMEKHQACEQGRFFSS
jgi:hypothetical protein